MYHVFRFVFCAVYVECDNVVIADMLIKKTYTTEAREYLGEFSSKQDIHKACYGYFVEGVDKDVYQQFVQQYGFVKLMCSHWAKATVKATLSDTDN